MDAPMYYYVTCYFENGSHAETIRLSSYTSVLDYLSNAYDQWHIVKTEIILE